MAGIFTEREKRHSQFSYSQHGDFACFDGNIVITIMSEEDNSELL